MYSTSHPASSASMNGMAGGIIDDGSGTINPAALNTPVLSANTALNASNANQRGQKRSRSPDYNESRAGGNADHDDTRQKKRGRPSKAGATAGTEQAANQTPLQHDQHHPSQAQTPRGQTQGTPQQSGSTPTQASPPKATPTKSVIKALPTVRDHTTDQLSPEGDEYIPREIDDAGEKKVASNGKPLEGREYKCRTFLVPNRGDKLFMLATECARVLGYRDSYLLFNKNRSLYKIIATQPEKDDLIGQEILPYSYRSRQIAIVTAKSMFRQFGSRVITNGRRVRDDYWEAKAKKQGFTEEDMAGEKRPGGARAAREAQAAEAANAAAMGHHQEVVYNNGPGTIPVDAHGHPQLMQAGMGGPMASSLAPLPMISLTRSDDMRLREYNNIQRPRQEMAGAPYQDRTTPSSSMDIMNQAGHTTEFNKILNQQQRQRSDDLNKFYRQPREVNVSSPLQQSSEPGPALAQNLQSPHINQATSASAGQQPLMQQQSAQIMPQSYPQQQHHPQAASSPPARTMPQQLRQDSMSQQRPSPLQSYGSGSMPQTQYSYPPSSQMWGQPPHQPQQSPITSQHGLPQYSAQHQPHQAQSPHHSQSPHQNHQQTPPQLQHSQSSGSLHGGMYQNMPSMPQNYGAGMAGRSMYQPPPQQHSPSPHQYLQQTTTGGGASLQGWAPPPPQQQHGHQGWQGGYEWKSTGTSHETAMFTPLNSEFPTGLSLWAAPIPR